MACEAFNLAESHAGLAAQLMSVAQGDVDAQVKDLRARAEASQDAVARRQLELAASSLGEELNRLDTLSRKRERLLAQLHAQVALLERARVSLVGAAGTEASAKSAQAAQLAKRLASLGEENPPAPEPEQVTQPAAPRISS
jgi:peptidoglycan hydrolase CwlO-like protein